MSSTTPLTDAINALTTYANEVTGKSDATLSDAVGSLVDGYGGGNWTRPSEWMPYVNGWDDEDFEGIYFVYDTIYNTDESSPDWWALNATTNTGKYKIEQGYVNNIGEYTVTSSELRNSNSGTGGFLPFYDEEENRYFVVRIVPNETNHIRTALLASPQNSLMSTIYGTGISISSSLKESQPCIEIYGQLPYFTTSNNSFCNDYLVHVNLINLNSLTSLAGMFANCRALEKIDGMATWDVSNVTSMDSLFLNCFLMSDFSDILNWDVSNVQNTNTIFQGTGISSVFDLSNWTINSSNGLSNFVRNCKNLKKIILPNISASNFGFNDILRETDSCEEVIFTGNNFAPSSLSYTFNSAKSLRYIDTTTWDLSNCTNMNLMFINCSSLKSIDFSQKDTSKVTKMQQFASGCENLRFIDFTGCDFSNITDTATNQFANCHSLIRLKGFVYYQSFSLTNSTLMPVESLVEVLTNLPTVSSSKTITLGTTNKNKLTAEQMAIATEKGWTIA